MHRTPLFFKVLFGFIACLIVAGIGAGAALVMNLVDLGPEGVGRAAGAFMRGFNDATR